MSVFGRVREAVRKEKEKAAAAERAARLEREELEVRQQEELRLRLTQPFLQLVGCASASLDGLLADPGFVAYLEAVAGDCGEDKKDKNAWGPSARASWRCLKLFGFVCGSYGVGDTEVDISWRF